MALAHNVRPKTDAQIIESAGKSNPRVNRFTIRLRVAGGILILVDVGISAVLVYSAPPEQRRQVFIREVGALIGAAGGAWLGCRGGASAGAVIGVWVEGWGAVPGAAIGCVVGAVGGGWGGAQLGEAAANALIERVYPSLDVAIEQIP